MPAANVVMVAEMTSKLNLEVLFCLLPIVYVNYIYGANSGKNNREKVPFFGIDGVIVGARYNTKSRGIRKSGGQIKNVVSVDAQTSGKNIHLKISVSKIQLAGALSRKMGEEAYQLALDLIKLSHENWKYVKSLDSETLEASIGWLKDKISHSPRLSTREESYDSYQPGSNEGYSQEGNEGNEGNEGEILIHDTKNPFIKKEKFGDLDHLVSCLPGRPDQVDERAVMYLGVFAHEYDDWESFQQRIDWILTNDTPIYEVEPELGTSTIHNAVFHYGVGREISLITITQGLCARGYLAGYNNWISSKKMSVAVPILGGRDCKKMEAHRFTIYQKGGIRQSSPSEEDEAESVKQQLLTDIHSILEEESSNHP